jgi:hypothetical protein
MRTTGRFMASPRKKSGTQAAFDLSDGKDNSRNRRDRRTRRFIGRAFNPVRPGTETVGGNSRVERFDVLIEPRP